MKDHMQAPALIAWLLLLSVAITSGRTQAGNRYFLDFCANLSDPRHAVT